MAGTVTSLKFDMKSAWDGSGMTKAREDVRLFNEELRKLSGKHVRVNIDAIVDDTKARKKLQALADEKYKVTVVADPDVAEAKRQLKEAARDQKTRIKADADTGAAEQELDRTARNRKTKLTIDVEQFRAQLAALNYALQNRSGGRVKISADTAEAKAELQNLVRWAEQSGHKVRLSVNAETGRASAEIAVAARDRRVTLHTRVDTSQLSQAQRIFTAFGESALNGFEGIGRGVAGIGSGLTSVLGKGRTVFYTLIAIGAITLLPLVGTLVQAAGVIALMPAGIAAVGAALGALVIGSMGMLDAFKAAKKMQDNSAKEAQQHARDIAAAQREVQQATRGVEAANRDVAQAQRSVVSAQRDVRDAEEGIGRAQRQSERAQKSLNDARKEALKDLQDINRQLRRTRLDEEGAALAVAEARRDLLKTQMDPKADALDRAEAQHRVNEALADQQDTLEKNRELAEKAAEANAKGVEGSDKVVRAKDEVTDATDNEVKAHERLGDAQQRVADAQQSVIDAQTHVAEAQQNLAQAQQNLNDKMNEGSDSAREFAEKMAKLSPAAQDFVNKMLALRGAFDDFKKSVQDKLFDGLGDSFTNFANHWLPTVKDGLSGVAGEINQGVRKALADLDTDANRSTVSKIFDNIKASIQPVIDGLKELFEGFLNLAGVGSELLPGMAGGFDNIGRKFNEWTAKPENQQKFRDFLKESIQAFKDVMNLIIQIGRIFGELFKGSDQGTQKNGQSWVAQLADSAKKLADYLGTPEGQQRIKDFFAGVKQTVDNIARACELALGVLDRLDKISGNRLVKLSFGSGDMTGKILSGDFGGMFGNIPTIIKGEMATAEAVWKSSWHEMKAGAQDVWGGIQTAWSGTLGAMREGWNNWYGNVRDGWSQGWNSLKETGSNIWGGIQTGWKASLDALKLAWDSISQTVGAAWSTFWDGTKTFASDTWKNIRQGFSDMGAGITSILDAVVKTAESIWNRIKGIFAKPINWVIGIWNDKVAPAIGLGDKKIPQIPENRDGGMFNGRGGGRQDSNLSYISHGEYIVNARSAFRNRDLLDAINFGGAVPAYKDGGPAGESPVSWMMNWVHAFDPRMQVTSTQRDSADYHGQGKAADFSDAYNQDSPGMQRLAEAIAKTWGGSTLELIHAGGFQHNIKNGQDVGDGMGLYGAATMAQHLNHVHWAVDHPLQDSEGGGGVFGSLGRTLGGIVDKGRELISSMFQRLTDPLINAIPDPFASGMGDPMGKTPKAFAGFARDRILDLIKDKEPKGFGGSGGPIGGVIPDGDRLRIIDEALALTNTPPPGSKEEWQRGLNTLITRESSWNPAAISTDPSDPNVRNGTPSKGLMQTIDTTFAANKVPGHNDIWNPVDNVAAGINYIKNNPNYGTISNVQQANANMPPKGYAEGTTNAPQGWAMVGENGPEMVKFNGGEQVWTLDDIIKKLQAAAVGSGIQTRAEQAGQNFLQANADQFTSDLTGGEIGNGAIPQLFKQSIAYAQALAGWDFGPNNTGLIGMLQGGGGPGNPFAGAAGVGETHYHVTDVDEILRKQRDDQKFKALGFGG
ncbi:transglycosylase SLT domain-containing protein [Nocardia nova]|uniref:transglycosylase SLT domain-containing protein n=1 Tax=Nocardia nova TaxID=37330 RepID=UPI002738C353|nr:transglycosylase SLT domain-containing protein [Nocardia nova]